MTELWRSGDYYVLRLTHACQTCGHGTGTTFGLYRGGGPPVCETSSLAQAIEAARRDALSPEARLEEDERRTLERLRAKYGSSP